MKSDTTLQPPALPERPRRLAPERYVTVKRELEIMMEQDICQPSFSQWASSLHLVKKKDGSWRSYRDFHKLNSVTTLDRYPFLHIQDFTYHLAGCTIFSKIDRENIFTNFCSRRR